MLKIKSFLVCIFLLLSMITADVLFATTPKIRINEFMAVNASALRNGAGNYEDWIELYNASNEPIPLAGWSLTDSRTDLTQFQFPETSALTIKAGGYLLVYASGSTNMIVSGDIHVNFKLSKNGEYLAIVNPEGGIEHEVDYPAQYTDVSYGVAVGSEPDLRFVYFQEYTPRRANSTNEYGNPVGTVKFSEKHGFATNSFYLTLSCDEPEAAIYYTTDGSVPSKNSNAYTTPLRIRSTTVLRALAFKEGHLPGTITSATWIFPEDVVNQDTMRRTIVRNRKDEIISGLKELPTISLVTARTNLYGSYGIFDNYTQEGKAWERPVSVELINPDGTEGFTINAGIRIRGATGRASAKKSLRLFFDSDYDGDLVYPMFQDEGVTTFSKLDLRAEQNNAWSSNVDSPWQNTFVREVFARDTQKDLGVLYTRSRHYNLYINGQYWGIYLSQERGEADFASSYLGGKSSEWDALKSSSKRVIEVKDGNNEAFYQFYRYAYLGFTGDYIDNYTTVKGLNPDGSRNPDYPILLDEDNLIYYLLVTFYIADVDSPLSWINIVNNINTVYNRVNPAGFKWLKHDAELSLGAHLNVEDMISYFQNATYWSRWTDFNPMDLHRKLIQNNDYAMRFADLAWKEYSSKGVFGYTNALKRWNNRMGYLTNSVIAESARWGNQYGGKYTVDHWKMACGQVTDNFMVGREFEMFPILKKQSWFPTTQAPMLSTNENQLTIRSHADVYFTTDGTDPRLSHGNLNPGAQLLSMHSDSGLTPETVVYHNSLWKCYDTGSEPSEQRTYSTLNWKSRLYADADWEIKSPAAGFNSTTPYLRTSFVLETIDDVQSAIASIKGNGSLWINGVAVGTSVPVSVLRQGRNLVTAQPSGKNSYSVAIIINHDNSYWKKATMTVDANSVLKFRALENGIWSAASNLDMRDLDNKDCSRLRITEMMYAANLSEEESAAGYTYDDFAWIEFQNTDSKWINLEGVSFSNGITYTFPNYPLAPGAYCVLAKNEKAFRSRYDAEGINVLFGYKGNLAHKGEEITVVSDDGKELIDFTYSNQWYPCTDRAGHSLVLVDSQPIDRAIWSTEKGWAPSSSEGGTPGKEDSITISICNVRILYGVLYFEVSGTRSDRVSIESSTNSGDWSPVTNWSRDGNDILVPLKQLRTAKSQFFRIVLN